MRPAPLLRVEGLALGIAAVGLYLVTVGDPLWFVLLVLLPDVSIAGYLAGSRVGSLAYNAAHLLVVPLGVLGWGLWTGDSLALAAAFAWLAHIGADRAMGLGLKYADAPFRETHLQRV
jgi:hypothetical protein